jgi:hypothetical protein
VATPTSCNKQVQGQIANHIQTFPNTTYSLTQAVGGAAATRGEGGHTCKAMTKGEQIFFRLGTLNVNSLKVVRKRRNILRQLKSHCDVTCFQESKLDGASANDVCKDDSSSWAFNNRTTKSGSVAIHLQEKLGRYTDEDEFNNVDGSVVGRSVEFNGYKLYLVSVYAPCCGKSKSRLAANMEIL